MADSRNIRRTGGDEEKEVASGREEGGAVASKRGKERERERERERGSSRNCIGICMAISILELTYLEMFSLAEIHGRLLRLGPPLVQGF